MWRNRPVYLLAVLRRAPAAWGVVAGAALTFAALCLMPSVWLWTLSRWDPAYAALNVAHMFECTKQHAYDGFLLGSSQINQVQPSILRSITGLDFYNSAISGGDIAYMLSMSRAIASRSRNKAIVLAEFSRYVVEDIEELVYRDTLRFVPARYWALHELGYAWNKANYRTYYLDGIVNSLLPLIRYKEGIKARVIASFPRLATLLMHPRSKPGLVRLNCIHQDGHNGPYPHQPPPYAGPGAYIPAAAGNAHKLRSWDALLQLHLQGKIMLVLVIPPSHVSWAGFYAKYYGDPQSCVVKLRDFLQSNGIAVIDCSTLPITDDDCMDAHHFNWSGGAKFSEYVANQLITILHRDPAWHAPQPLTGKRLSEVLTTATPP